MQSVATVRVHYNEGTWTGGFFASRLASAIAGRSSGVLRV
jgi:hypothetical protein